ncbi:MAG: hypothetical protein FJ379_02890 [Verrucomicrobia bacterium]|nr:hypothetical protein [Verrucomicrobiota bacterium]
MDSAGTRYLVCSVPRSGSTLFCHLLRSTRCLGMQPFDGGRFEYLVPYLRGRFRQVDWSSTGLVDFLEIPFGSSATSNGVMGFKVMWDLFDQLLETARGLEWGQVLGFGDGLESPELRADAGWNHDPFRRPDFWWCHAVARLRDRLQRAPQIPASGK